MKFKTLNIIALAFCVGFVSCTKEEDPDAPAKGSITGKVRLADEFGNVITDHGQVGVVTNTGKDGLTIENGSYLIYGLGDGTYDLTFTKYDYGTYKRFGVPVTNFANTELSGLDTLGKVSTTLITGLVVAFDVDDSTWSFNCNVSPVPDTVNRRGIRLFFSTNPSLSASDYEYTPGNKWMATSANGSITGFTTSNFLSNGFNKGDTVYVIAYGESVYANIYIDPATGKKVFPNVNVENPSNVAMFILP